jgi:paraquat-inducible protein B
MSENGDAPRASSADDAVPDVVVHSGRGVSLIWIIPIVAVAVGGYLAWNAIQNAGEKIVIEMATAEWLESDKTKIKYRSVTVGTVDDIIVSREGVELHCSLEQKTALGLTKGAKFWVVHPRIGGGEVTGLGTLLSGAYISMEPGPHDGKKVKRFVGLEDPPLRSAADPGLRLVLHAETLYSLGPSSPIYFRETRVGSIERHKLADDGGTVLLETFIEPEFADRVKADSRFWNVGGIEVNVGPDQLEVQTESLAAMLSGGVAFDSPGGENSKPAAAGDTFWLHSSHGDLAVYPFRYGGLRVFVEGEQLGSLKKGSLVYYREVPVGSIIDVALATDSRAIRTELNIMPGYAPLVRTSTKFWNASGISADLGLTGLHVRTESLQALLGGGIAFATPPKLGAPAAAGSVFRLHPEGKDAWLSWSPLIWRGDASKAPADAAKHADAKPDSPHGVARFFHHKGKEESEAADDSDKPVKVAIEEKKHGFFHDLFHRDD